MATSAQTAQGVVAKPSKSLSYSRAIQLFAFACCVALIALAAGSSRFHAQSAPSANTVSSAAIPGTPRTAAGQQH
ncbi:MAG: hypothetical protein ACRD3S_02635, partial [Terracidiphilus sp.]